MDNWTAANLLKPEIAVWLPDGRRGTVADTVYWSEDLQQWRCHVWPDQGKFRNIWSWIQYGIDPKSEWVSLKCEDAIPIERHF